MNAKSIILARAEVVASCVQAGWDMLDAHRPHWRTEVDAYSVDLDDASACVLGQAFNEEWEALDVEHETRIRAWLATNQSTERPTPTHFDNPYSYGLAQMIIASGVKVDIVEQRDDFARRHGWLAGSMRSDGAWEHVSSDELNQAWSLALSAAPWGMRR